VPLESAVVGARPWAVDGPLLYLTTMLQAAPGAVVALTVASEPGDTGDVTSVIVVEAAAGGAVGWTMAGLAVGSGVGAGVGAGVGEGLGVGDGVGRGVDVACALGRGETAGVGVAEAVGLPDDPPLDDDAAPMIHTRATAPVIDQRMPFPTPGCFHSR